MNVYELLVEGRKENLIVKYQDRAMDGRLESFFDDEFQQQTNFKYADWILKQYYGQMMKKYPLEVINDMVEKFHRLRKNLSKRDINQYRTADELQKELESYSSKSQDTKVVEGKDSKKIFDDEKISVIKPLTFEGSCKYGASTKWCTTNKNEPSWFQSYKTNGNLYYIHLKNENKKYALFKGFSDPNFITWYDETDIKLQRGDIQKIKSIIGKTILNLIDVDHLEDVKIRKQKGITAFEEMINNFDMVEFVREEIKGIKVKMVVGPFSGMVMSNGNYTTRSTTTVSMTKGDDYGGFKLVVDVELINKDTVKLSFYNGGNEGFLSGKKELKGNTKVRAVDMGKRMLINMVKQYTTHMVDLVE